jgi:hypothetical protein
MVRRRGNKHADYGETGGEGMAAAGDIAAFQSQTSDEDCSKTEFTQTLLRP